MNIKNTKTKILALDLKGCLYLNQWSHHQHILIFFKAVSRLGDRWFWYVMLIWVWMIQGWSYTPSILYILFGGLTGTCIYKGLKHRTTRPRPYQVHQVIQLGERPLDHFSFPSGHTLHAVMASIVLGFIQPLLLVLMLPFSICVAISRMVLGLHYPSDVIVGAIIGSLLGFFIIYLAPFFSISL
ncbi:phosphatase PAP2 family protein [Acinetobacter shaoyimingii]|uniref:undecaprenyl-diphosphate phosphatase n=1 Tax=Acinetobacter shaoyimingii TaxID=2715164 RepID=A0A6G8RY63_9GAMM|nr:phosphatase PAP2 family protein [Acinetobacter shaoyimingii]NHB58759.1 phosphatase PAP2 family protein [Acinetobacter shaoyimingii]QIO06886.1 phosphatase PAP2 family protein [Acinetobacter shaoyimingii]